MIKYDNYKDSGTEWLGEIPKHWEIKRIKDVFAAFGSGSTPNSSNPNYYDDGNINWLNTSDLNNGIVVNTKMKITNRALSEVSLKIYPKNSLAIAMYGQGKTRGTVGLIDFEFTTNQASCVMFKPKKLDPKFILYWFNYKYTGIRAINVGASQPNMNQDFVKLLQLQFPPLPEQTAIAQYLVDKTQAIDKKVTLLQQKISYYKELRKSIINKAVTKGLNPEVELEDSEIGIKVPKSWNRFRLKDIGNLYSGLSGKSGDDFNQDDNENNKGFIPFTNILANTYISDENIGNVVIFPSEKQNKVKENDLFFLMSSEGYEDIGKSALLNHHLDETYLNSFCKGFRITNKFCTPAFLNYLLQSRSYRQFLTIEGKGFTRINLKMEKVSDFCVYLPNQKDEQTAIANYLDEKTTQIDTIVSNIEQQIEKLKELRKTLINDVVTGKIKVA